MASTASDTTPLLRKTPQLPYRDTGAAGKSVYGQAPSWKYKPLPTLPYKKDQASVKEPVVSKFREEGIDSMKETTESEEVREAEAKARKEGKIKKTVKNFSTLLSGTGSKSYVRTHD